MSEARRDRQFRPPAAECFAQGTLHRGSGAVSSLEGGMWVHLVPEFLASQSLSKCSILARLCFPRFLAAAGDAHGCFRWNVPEITGRVFPPGHGWPFGPEEVQAWLIEYLGAGILGAWEAEGQLYGCWINFAQYNRLKGHFKRKTPVPPDSLPITPDHFTSLHFTSNHVHFTSSPTPIPIPQSLRLDSSKTLKLRDTKEGGLGETKSDALRGPISDNGHPEADPGGMIDPDPLAPRTKGTLKRRRTPKSEPLGFPEWYETVYPLRTKRDDAAKAWDQVNPDPEELTQGTLKWAEHWRLTESRVPYPATCLRARQWRDDPKPSFPASKPGQATPAPGEAIPHRGKSFRVDKQGRLIDSEGRVVDESEI